MNSLLELRKELDKLANPRKAKIFQGFFRTGKGEYGEGDIFLGITVPEARKIAIKFKDLSFSEIVEFLKSKIHEERLIALLILVNNFNAGNEKTQEKIYNFYLKNTKYINNWDLVDLSADKILGGHLNKGVLSKVIPPASAPLHSALSGHPSSFATPPILIRLAIAENIWERRIAIVATYYFIKNNKFDETLKIAEILLHDQHDLIQKAVGWMLREVGKRDLKTEIEFLNNHYKKMPRTMLRHAIEKFPEKLRLSFMER